MGLQEKRLEHCCCVKIQAIYVVALKKHPGREKPFYQKIKDKDHC
jgi:hypothetical protein